MAKRGSVVVCHGGGREGRLSFAGPKFLGGGGASQVHLARKKHAQNRHKLKGRKGRSRIPKNGPKSVFRRWSDVKGHWKTNTHLRHRKDKEHIRGRHAIRIMLLKQLCVVVS